MSFKMKISISLCLSSTLQVFKLILPSVKKLIYFLGDVVSSRNEHRRKIFHGAIIGFLLGLVIIRSIKLNEWHLRHRIYPKYGGDLDEFKNTSVADSLNTKLRILCWVYVNDTVQYHKAGYVRGTWGRRCNKFLVFTSYEEHTLPNTIKIPRSPTLFETSAKCMKYLRENLIDEADWFLSADYDMYVIMENLRYVLLGYNPEEKIYLTLTFAEIYNIRFLADIFGYVISKPGLISFYNLEILQQSGKLREEYLKDVVTIDSDVRESPRMKDLYLPHSKYKSIDGSELLCFEANFRARKEFAMGCSYNYIAFHLSTPGNLLEVEFYMYSLNPYGISYDYRPTKENKHVSSPEKPTVPSKINH